MGSGRRRQRRVARVGALGVAALVLASCHTGLGATSLLLVAPDGTVAFDLRCTHAQQTCTGTALLRVAGVDTDAVPFSVGPGESAPLTAALTPE